MKHLFSKLEGETASIHIIDDNIDSSFRSIHMVDESIDRSLRSLPETGTEGNEVRPKPIFRRANSLNSIIVLDAKNEEYKVSEVYDYYDGDSCSRKVHNQNLSVDDGPKKNENKTQLSARMERHRHTRWDASPSTCRDSFQSTSTATTASLHNSFDTLALDDLDADEDSINPTRDRDHTAKTANTRGKIDDHSDDARDRRFQKKKKISASRFLIDKAIAISSGGKSCESRKSNRSRWSKKSHDTVASRGFNDDRFPLKSNSMHHPPSVPQRRCSIDDMEIPIASLEDLLTTGTRNEVPGCLRDLPYFNCDTHTM